MYGAVETFSKTINLISNLPTPTLEETYYSYAPSVRKFDLVYGKGSAKMVLFTMFKTMFTILGVDGSLMMDVQIGDLAETIVNEYPSFTFEEIKVFIQRFKTGRYKSFYGKGTYYMAVMNSLRVFKDEQSSMISTMASKVKTYDTSNDMTYEEWCKKVGKEFNPPMTDLAKQKENEEKNYLKAKDIVENKLNLSQENINLMRSFLLKDTGKTAEQIIKEYENKK